jgi:hypothetical protein
MRMFARLPALRAGTMMTPSEAEAAERFWEELQREQPAWESGFRTQSERTKFSLLSAGGSDAAADLAEALWNSMDDCYPDGGRREFLWWCYCHRKEIGCRVFSRVLAITWCRPKVGSLVNWGFPVSLLKEMFTHAAPEI